MTISELIHDLEEIQSCEIEDLFVYVLDENGPIPISSIVINTVESARKVVLV